MTESVSKAGSSTGAGLWDFLRAALVLGALVILTLAVIHHYGGNAQKAATILGIAAPVLAAVVGGTLGYYAGNTTGAASGAAKVKQQLDGPVKALDSHMATSAPTSDASEALGALKSLARF
jgi:hypothetical protein